MTIRSNLTEPHCVHVIEVLVKTSPCLGVHYESVYYLRATDISTKRTYLLLLIHIITDGNIFHTVAILGSFILKCY